MIHPSREADLAAEGEPEEEFNKGIAARIPKKTTAAGALVAQQRGPDPVPRSDVQADS